MILNKLINSLASSSYLHPELSGCITTLTVRNMEIANFCAAMDTLIDQDVLSDAATDLRKEITYYCNI